MVRKKTLAGCGRTDDDGEHRNAHVSLNRDEFEEVGLSVGDEVKVRVTGDSIELVPVTEPRAPL